MYCGSCGRFSNPPDLTLEEMGPEGALVVTNSQDCCPYCGGEATSPPPATMGWTREAYREIYYHLLSLGRKEKAEEVRAKYYKPVVQRGR